MDGTGTPPKALPESPSLSQEPSKKSDSGTKVSKSSPVKNSRENGIGVSINGKEGFDSSDLDDGPVGGQALVDRYAVDLGDKEVGGGLEDSEMNGVSSLLKMQESKNLIGLGSVLDVIDKSEKRDFQSGHGVSLVADICGDFHSSDVKEKSQFVHRSPQRKSLDANEGCIDGNIGDLIENRKEEEKMENEGHKFGVGDFVWGKVKSHPWWPGRVYDPSDASDQAKKVKQRDKILVAYFGDGTFAWCSPSQLKPLDENFVEMSKQSSSKNFLNAVEKAVDEVGRLVDLKMTCYCVPKENLIGFGRTLAVNAGIKEGLLVPEGGIDKFLTDLFKPADFLAALKCSAQVATVNNMLEFSLLKSCLSAFYRSKGYHLPSYYEPKPILGLEDDTRNWMDSGDYNSGLEVRIHGPVEEDWLSSPTSFKNDQTSQSMFRKCQGVSEDGQYQRRKQKSLAEILDGEAENKDDVLAEEGTKSSKEASLAKRKKRKFMGEDMNAEGKIGAMNVTKEESSFGEPASLSRRKKRKVSDETDSEGKNKMEDVANAGADLAKPLSSSGREKGKDCDDADVNSIGSSDLFSKQRAMKDAKVSESLVLADNKITSLEAIDSGMVKTEGMKRRGRKKKSSSVAEGDSDGHKNEEMEENIVSAEKKGSLLRERKRSKYLCPPYTNISKGLRKQEIEAESMKVSSEARLGERLTKAARHLTLPSPTLKFSGERFVKKPSRESGQEHETPDNSIPQTPKQDGINFDPMLVKAPANEVLSKIRSAALNPQNLNERNSLEFAEEFFSAFRSSIYCNGSDHEIYSERQPGRKRKPQKSEPAPLVEEQNQSDHSSSDHKSKKTKKNEEAKSVKPKVKKAANAPDMKSKDKDSTVEAPDAALYVTFGPGSTLPSKNDLIKLYSKFGALNEEQTEMYYTNYCARVVFLKSSEAEEAFNDSQLSSPFKAANATFRLRYLSAETKTRELRDISSTKSKLGTKAPDMSFVLESTDNDVSPLNYIKQKLEMIKSLLETSDGKISPDLKSILEGEIKVLLEKVSIMASSSS
ncbi:hypothetical protein JCGZ_09577 [Jatropha curcas]|uniref:PWWP domain-containing protein n=1 Tax=Jatropha curcas TaxID=180498 RepID=A0A067LDN3_JATCU|nr:uncharacterized protein LOC105641452 [Jatropha curcas]KDP45328.1 hypothetical protein JCGZ_09577 [Jatropha curcas]